MKLLFNTLALLFFFSLSCESQEKKNDLSMTYIAQTRGFIYSLQLKDNYLELNNNNSIKKLELSETDIKQITKILSEIDFENIENNISIDDLAVDKAIQGNFDLVFKQKKHSFQFNHYNLPEKIKNLLSYLEGTKE